MLIKVLMLILLPVALFAKEDCGLSSIQYIYKKKSITEKAETCFNQMRNNNFLYSKNCKGLQCKQLLYPEKRPLNISHYKYSVGSPGFKICRELGGSPQIFKYKRKDKWVNSARCIFNKDTFVTNNILLSLWKDYLIK